VRAQLRQDFEERYESLVGQLLADAEDPNVDAATRLKISSWLVEQGLGRAPTAASEPQVDPFDLSKMSTDELLRLANPAPVEMSGEELAEHVRARPDVMVLLGLEPT
jgi:hypothetical protein